MIQNGGHSQRTDAGNNDDTISETHYMSDLAFKNKPIEIETSYVKETPQAGQIPEKIERVDSKMLISTIKDMPEFMR